MQPDVAAWLDLKAQEELSASEAIHPFENELNQVLGGKLTIEQSLLKWVTGQLADLGFEVEWRRPQRHDPPETMVGSRPFSEGGLSEGEALAQQVETMWHRFQGTIDDGHLRTLELALGVVFFVAVMVIFTCADLMAQLKARWAFLVAGLLGAFAATGFVFVVDRLGGWFSSVANSPVYRCSFCFGVSASSGRPHRSSAAFEMWSGRLNMS